jgi:outer membrane protein
MKKYQIILLLPFLVSNYLTAQTNTNDTMSFSLLQALDYAAGNSTLLKNAYADIAIADQSVKEVKAMGIPQLKGQVQFQDAIQKQVFVFPVNGVGTPIRVGNKYTTQSSLNLTWLMLDGTYFLGLKAAKQFTNLSKRIATKTEADVKIDVAKTYFLALITKENINLVNSNYATLNNTFTNVKAMNTEGFTESLDVDRLQLQINNLEISRQKLIDQYTIVLGLLKVKMGLAQDKPIKLTDDIDALNAKFMVADSTAELNLNTRADYQILKQQLTLNTFNVKRYQYGKYPSLAGSYTYMQSNFGETIKYDQWYSNSFVALQLNVPIFSGFANNARIQKAKIEQLKTENSISQAENAMKLEVIQTRLKYLRAIEYVEQQKSNLDLANRILNVTTIKYNEGVGSNLELITANQDLKTTQTNYLSAVYDLLVAKLDYQIALGQTIQL